MTNIQIQEIALYSKGQGGRVIPFKLGSLNIIHGVSQTGKSAIIPIIDYCLCSNANRIPVGTIREKCIGFGINLKIDDENLLIVRSVENPEEIKHTRGKDLSLTKIKGIEWQKTDKEKFKFYLNNNLFGLTFLDTTEEKKDNKDDRPSYRDLVAFNFQAQNIVANPNCLLYKTDVYFHRHKIKKIFDYIIGAQTSEQLADEYIKQKLNDELKDLKYKKEQDDKIKQEILNNSEIIMYKAMEYGLIPNQVINMKDSVLIEELLRKIAQKEFSDIDFSEDGDELLAEKLQTNLKRIDELYFELTELKQERNNLKEFLELVKQQENQLEVKKERLEISKFIKSFCVQNEIDATIIEDVDKLCNNLMVIENQLTRQKLSRNSIYEAKLASIKDKIYQKSKEIQKSNKIIEILEQKKQKKSLLDEIYVNIIGKAKNNLSRFNDNEELSGQIADIEQQITDLTIDIEPIRAKQLNSIVNKANQYVPKFAEFDEIDSFDIRDLTVKVKKKKDFHSSYLWETGSGSNWVAYHIATLLGLHRHFIQIESPVLNFLIFDQPSQVYFPNTNYHHTSDFQYDNVESKKRNSKKKSDKECVQEIFTTLNKAVKDNKPKNKDAQSYSNLQIILLDHAGKDIWEDLEKEETVNILPEWTYDNPLVPKSWKYINKGESKS